MEGVQDVLLPEFALTQLDQGTHDHSNLVAHETLPPNYQFITLLGKKGSIYKVVFLNFAIIHGSGDLGIWFYTRRVGGKVMGADKNGSGFLHQPYIQTFYDIV